MYVWLKSSMMGSPKGRLVAVCETDGFPKAIKYNSSRKDLCVFKHKVESAQGHPQLTKDFSLYFCWVSPTETKYEAVSCWVEADRPATHKKKNKGKSSPKRLDFFVNNPCNKSKTVRLSRLAGLLKFQKSTVEGRSFIVDHNTDTEKRPGWTRLRWAKLRLLHADAGDPVSGRKKPHRSR